MTSKMNNKQRYVRCPKCLNVLPEPSEVPVYKCGGCHTTLQAKKRNNVTVDTPSQKPDDDSSGKRKVDQVFGDQESSKQQLLPNVTDESDQNSDHDDLHRSKKDQDAAKIGKNGSVDAASRGIEEYLFGKQKIKQLSDDHEASSSSNQQEQGNSMDEQPHRNSHNDPRSSTELSGHEDPESSPDATGHIRTDQEQEQNKKQDQDHYQDAGKKQENITVDAALVGLDHSLGKQKINQLSDDNEASCSLNQPSMVDSINDLDENSDDNRIDQDYLDDHDQVFLSCRHESEFEDSCSEFEEAFANTRIVRVSDGGSKSSFKSLIAEKLLDTRQKKPANLDEDDVLSADGSTDLHHPRRFDRYYEGSVSSFDGNDHHNPRKYRFGSITNEHVDSGNGSRFNRRSQIHHLNDRLGKDRSFYGLNEFHLNPKHHSHMISENPKMERIELLKMVRELQNQLDRTNILNPQQVPLHNNLVLNNLRRYDQRMAFSGEATTVGRHHCRPQDRHFSAQLPQQHVCCNGSHYEPTSYYSPCFPRMSSPIQQNHSEPEPTARFRLFNSPKKNRYVRPIANGSPWVTCYRCFKLLELPQSFLVLNKRSHSLKCGACLKVLTFTLSNGTHVSRYYPEETMAAPPSSEVEDYEELNGSRAGPVSCSESSFQKSYSTETDRNGYWEFGEERRKATMSRGPSGSTQPSSSRVSGRRKSAFESKGSPLHRLMGYASPSKVIRGW